MTDMTKDIARMEAHAVAMRSQLSHTLARLADRADVPGRAKARAASAAGTALRTVRDPANRRVVWAAAGLFVVVAAALLARRR